MHTPDVLWRPKVGSMERTSLSRFWRLAEQHANQSFHSYNDLHRWSVKSPADFWGLYAKFSGIKFRTEATRVKGPDSMPGTCWFPGSQLNFAENILLRRDNSVAIIARTETGLTRTLTFASLFNEVASCAAALKDLGVEAGDRVVGFIANIPEAVIAFLASASIGAIWSSCSPDFGARAATDRLGQIEPKVLFASDCYYYGGKRFDCSQTIAALNESLPTLVATVIVPYTGNGAVGTKHITWTDFLQCDNEGIDFVPLPFDHPLYILYSSGTTGPPKCIVHGAGGSLIQHRKEHQLHCDLHENDVMLYTTTCGWMMWNWLITALAGGTTIVLYEGNPGYPNMGSMWRMAGELDVSCFGTSAAFIEAGIRGNVSPRKLVDVAGIKSILSTGAPLSANGFRWIHKEVGEHIRISSISGGTDIVSCFVLGNPLLPVYAGEIQCAGLGMDIAAFSDDGHELVGQKGELVCRKPFPSMPISFWNDPDGCKYSDAYFRTYPGVWHHGDFVEITDRGTVIIYGRSDSTLKPGGVRIGTAEIYRPLESLTWIIGCIAAELPTVLGDEIVLFVHISDDEKLSTERIANIKATIRREASPRHVPKHVIQVNDIPRTRNGKVAESAVFRILCGQQALNRDAIANPGCLVQFVSARQALLSGRS